MSTPTLGLPKLNKAAKHALAYIRGAVRAGVSANKTEQYLRDAGIGIRRKTLQQIHRTFKAAQDNTSLYIPDNGNRKPIASIIPISPYSQTRKYLTTVNVSYYDPVSDESFEQPINVLSNSLRPVNETINDAMITLDRYDMGYELDTEGSYIESIFFSDNPRL